MTARGPLSGARPAGGAVLRRLSALRRDRRGAIAVLGTFAVLLTGVVSIFVTDLARAQIARGRLQTAADAAMLASARDLGAPRATLEAVARGVFDANMRDMGGGFAVTGFALDLAGGTTETSATRISLSVDARLPTLTARVAETLRLSDVAAVDMRIVSTATKRVMGAEVVMVLDNTGSMNGQPIADLRAAAATLTEALFGGRPSVPNLYVGMVNYSATVNIGRQHADWTGRTLAQIDADFAPTRWKGCVRVRSAALGETDDPVVSGAMLTPQFWPSSRIGTNPDVFDSFYNANRAHRNIWPPLNATRPPVDERQAARNDGYGPNLGCPAPILPLSESRDTVLDAILGRNGVPGIEAWHRGGTFGNFGLVWGWRALSPRWRGQWRRADGTVIPHLPLAYDTPFHNKIIVLMTDGANGHFQTDMTAYGRPDEILARSQIDASMLRLCDRIKRAGVIIYAITFGPVPNAATRNTYTNCASDPATELRIAGQKYFHAPTGVALRSAFENIAGQVQELRLVQ